jgi:uncharacterized membrane protein YsdA (DUF1294 family)
MLLDKYFAINKMWRVPEKYLFAIAVLGGSLGCICGMYTVRHKTRHLSFTLGMPGIMAVQIALIVLWLSA